MSVGSTVNSREAVVGIGSAIAVALSVQGIYDKLKHVNPGDHTLKVRALFIAGMTNPGDGKFAEKARKKHADIPKSDLAAVWGVVIVCVARATGRHDREYMRAAVEMGRHLGIPDLQETGYSTYERNALDLAGGVRKLPDGARKMFWQAIHDGRIQSALGRPADDAVVQLLGKTLTRNFAGLYA